MISIIIPTYNRFEILQETLDRLNQLKTTVIYEVIVVNDGATFTINSNHPLHTVYKNPGKGAASARNYGASKANYEILFFIDDDMWVSEENLEAIAELSNTGILKDSVIVLNWKYPDVLLRELNTSKVGRYLMASNYHTLEGRCHTTFPKDSTFVKREIVGSGSLVITKELFELAGKYNPEFSFQGEDLDFSIRLKKINASILIYTKTFCLHNQKDRLNIEEFLDRAQRGFYSQFADKRFVPSLPIYKKVYYSLLVPFDGVFKWILHQIPNNTLFDFISFKIIGILSSVTFYTSYKKRKNIL